MGGFSFRSGSREAFAESVLPSRNAHAFSYTTTMPYEPKRHVGGLVRLDPGSYRGHAYVHWSMTMQKRATGWLAALHHAKVRELLCHTLARFQLVCPSYCLMPDHGHFLWIGVSEAANQQLAAAHFRKAWNQELNIAGNELQRQPFDHVLREEERERGAFVATAHYIFENPVRNKLCVDWRDYSFSGALVPGYPDMDPRAGDYWERFWRVYAKLSQSRDSLPEDCLYRNA
jgi:putative transposase